MQVVVSLTVEIEASTGISEMEEQIQEAGKLAMRQAMKQGVRQWKEAQRSCPHCGERACRLEGTARRVTATRFGRVEVVRRWFRCQKCRRRVCPANRLFAPLKGLTITPDVQEAAILAGCAWLYRVATHLLNKLSGTRTSAEKMRVLTNRQGKHRAAQQQEKAETACAELSRESKERHTRRSNRCSSAWMAAGCVAENSAAGWKAMEDLSMPVDGSPFSWSKRGTDIDL